MSMTSMERVLTALGHQEADRVPFFLLCTMHGAKELGMGIKEYFSKAEHVIQGQIRLREKYQHDCLYPLLYGGAEAEAFGGEILWYEDGPPNSGEPVVKKPEDILRLEVPSIEQSQCLHRTLQVIAGLKEQVQESVPIIGVVISPFSLPVMQMGFPAYIDLMYEQPELFRRLMAINQEFCLSWAKAQFKAGATAIAYFDPLASPEMTPPELYRTTGWGLIRHCLSRSCGPVVVHLGSSRAMPLIEELHGLGAVATGISSMENLAQAKQLAQGKIALVGSLNGITMRRWTREEARQEVKKNIAAAASGGGFILCDNHGEIPWQVSDEVLMEISTTVQEWGQYPLVM